ncbi:MAG: cyclic-di-AMP receptor [Cellulosilyticaceae bacterium]
MKLIIAILSKEDESIVAKELTKGGFFSTRLATKGGFLTKGNTTFLIGTQDDKVDKVIAIVKKHSKERTEVCPYPIGVGEMGDYSISSLNLNEVTVGGATIFVTDVERFEKV